jgi:hypothetical protein
MGNTLELLQDATIALSQNGTMKERLAHAWLSHLATLDAGHVPETFRPQFREMCEAMRRERPLPRECPVRASIRKMSNEEAGQYAELVVRLYAAIARSGNVAALPRPAPALAPIVQLFATER